MRFTLTVCVDTVGEQCKPGVHVNRWGTWLRSWRWWGGPLAFGYYSMDDRELVAEPHAWEK